MKLQFVVIGKTLDKHLDALIQEYAGRVKHYLPFEMEVIPELKNTKNLSEAEQKEKEGELLLKQLATSDYVVLLDEHGKEFRSTICSRNSRLPPAGWSLSWVALMDLLRKSMRWPRKRFPFRA